MLVLARKVTESIVVIYGPKETDRVVITIVRIGANVVRIGLDADEQVTIVRSELQPRDDDSLPSSSEEPPSE